MQITRRGLGLGVAGGAAALGLARPAIAQNEPIRFGWLASMTGPSSAPAIGFDRGVRFAAEAINAAGGVKGRRFEVITRDSQGEPTKAVNATQELISQSRVHAIWGPTNSGESLAVTAIMARAKMPNIHPCVVDSLIDPNRYPNAFRVAPSNGQWDDAVRRYATDVLKARKVAVFGDNTGYGVTAAKASSDAFKRENVEVVQLSNIDATQPDMTPDMLRARNAGAQAIVVWTVSTGMLARMLNTRAQMGWDVPFVGHPALSAGDIGGLLEKPENWRNVFCVGYRSCSYDSTGKLPARSQELVDRLQGKVNLNDSLLWWVACGVDAVNLVAKAVEATGSTASEAIIGHWNSLRKFPGYYGEYSFTPTQHNGYPGEDVVMSAANTGRNGAFALAPGYG
ncbi:ABC transporter substrate-binding protein [Roseomonas sp. NAR14]|uniref:ABC transporter substrate-binding protein n=1 Tax=Roseomonas acroporae TaxID=2937791 RepID=A0A9X2BWR9_9PROT|nr:ABC transporter substrate-binding protein [Roseomonas acroporae]MCK8784185.1 ABC transporter substrate-binding protein [Roseomonas acroporae]